MTLARPTLRFLLSHPAHFIALGFGAGLAPVAPGTFGTLVAIPIAFALRAYLPDALFLAAVVVFLALGVWAAAVTGRDLGVPDHGAIVWDEVVAFLLVLYFVGDDAVGVAFAFLLFRVFDIVKPWPAGACEKIAGGWGVMLDDLVAGIYANVALRAAIFAWAAIRG